MGYYKSLREFLQVLDQNGKLLKVSRPIIKETELIPLVRLQFRGLPEERRRGFIFDNVLSVTGKTYDASVATAVYAGSRQIYAMGMMCDVDNISEKWTKALTNRIKPVLVKDAPCQEEVHSGEELANEGLDELPAPVNTPGFSGVLRATASHVVTRDIGTGIQNCGVYQGQFLDRNIVSLHIVPTNHAAIHWMKCKEKNIPMQVAIVVGVPPNVAYPSVTSIPYGMDELAVAGGIAGEPLEVVKCKTVDLEVPAHAEIVIEGEASVDRLASSASFGEFTGYMFSGTRVRPYLMKVKAITHRKTPIFTVLLSQMPPSESSKISQIGCENVYYKHLAYDCNIPGILEVHFPESAGGRIICIIRMKKKNPSEAWQALSAANGFRADRAKIIIVVDEDIDPKDSDAVNWALAFRMQPHRDMKVMRGRTGGLDYSAFRPDADPEERRYPEGSGASALLIDATMKWPYPPISLPKKEYMEHALKIWKELGLETLRLKSPWFGYNLGYWTKDDEENADLILKGDYRAVGKKMLQVR